MRSPFQAGLCLRIISSSMLVRNSQVRARLRDAVRLRARSNPAGRAQEDETILNCGGSGELALHDLQAARFGRRWRGRWRVG